MVPGLIVSIIRKTGDGFVVGYEDYKLNTDFFVVASNPSDVRSLESGVRNLLIPNFLTCLA